MNKKVLIITIITSIVCIVLISTLYSLPELSNDKLSVFISLYIFEIGFTYNAYISMNTTNKAEYLKSRFDWKPVVDSYNFTFYSVVGGLSLSMLLLTFDITKCKVATLIYYVYLSSSQAILFFYWNFTSDFFKRPDNYNPEVE